MAKVMQPQEIEVWYLLPAIRRELALAMQRKGLKQREIASLLSVTDAAVSQYLNDKRAADVQFDSSVKRQILQSADVIIQDKTRLIPEIQRLSVLLKKEKYLCKLHLLKDKSLPANCDLCIDDNHVRVS